MPKKKDTDNADEVAVKGTPCPDCKSDENVVDRGEFLYCNECSVTFGK
jgi:hypothetical protein